MAAIDEMAAQVAHIPRQDFLRRFWRYQAGEHATFIGKTQSGKTTLAFELLKRTTTPELPGVILVMKPRDPTVSRWVKPLRYKRVASWPPPTASKWHPAPPPGWVLWPRLGDIDRDNARLHTQFRRALGESYTQAARNPRRRQGRIVFADEVVGLAAELNLADELNAVWMRGSGMGLGLWAATQRPFFAPQLMYSAPVHLFLHTDPDKRNRDRLKEIGGVNAQLVQAICDPDAGVMREHEFLYIDRRDYSMCVIGADTTAPGQVESPPHRQSRLRRS